MDVVVQAVQPVAAAPAEVFDYLTDLSKHRQWNPELVEVSRAGRLALGDSYDTVHNLIGKRVATHNLITKLVPQRELEITNTSGPLQYTVGYSVKGRGKQAELACRCQVRLDSHLFHLAAPIIEVMVRDKLRRDLQLFAAAAERQSALPAS